MSIEPEDSLLEQALRGDLPSAETEARVRRRLLAAGLALGPGVTTTTAAASGAAGAGSLVKAAALSWGVKAGVALAVIIPSVGLLLQSPSAPTHVSAPAASTSEPQLGAATVAVPSEPRHAEPGDAEREPEPAAAPASKAPRADAERASLTQPSPAPRPSRGDFAAQEPAARESGVAATTLAAETRLLDGAFAALSSGNLARAAELIAEHQSRYPQGLLQRERERARTRLSELSRGE